MIKVGFDLSQTAYQGGVSFYTKNLAGHLRQIKDLEMVFFYSSLRKPYSGELKNVKNYKLPSSVMEVLFNRLRVIPIEQLIGKVDIFHSSDWTQPPSNAKKVTTYHDVIPLKYPQWSHPKIVSVHKKRLELVEKEIDMVIAVSENTKKDLLEISNLSQEQITVIYEAASESFYPHSEKEIFEFKKRMGLPDNFVLALGGIGERKNLTRIKEAAKDFPLVITTDTIPYVSDEDLPLLYSAAKVLLYPSLYEGFGLPILEAMQSGTPVITSNRSSMPEIGSDASLYVDPENVQDIKTKLTQLMMDSNLHQDLVKKGLKRAKEFSWQKCADATVKVYKFLYNKKTI